ncbi:MAG: glutamine-hydrolyzing GMP synthase [Gammaproteobacteria bacterium]|nr:glutamine-hydrolyzing GMP synthase [Gammaproteobacteria bacterium]
MCRSPRKRQTIVSKNHTNDIHTQRLLILDFGSQYTQLIARRVREIGVYCEIHDCEVDEATIRAFAPNGIILSGGPETVTTDAAPRAVDYIFTAGVPVLGICYGMQTMASQLGGEVEAADHHEYGFAQVRAHGHSPLLKDIQDIVNEEGHGLLDVWMSHGDHVTVMPDGFKLMASTDSAPIAGMFDDTRHFYALQFHPEVTHTQQGGEILSRFVLDICGCEALWTAGNIANDSVARIRQDVGDEEVLLGLSGGVDSSVVAALLHKAIGDQLTCVFVDNGLLRHQEGDQVMDTFAEHMGVKVIRVDAEDRFLSALKGIDDPEKKRKVIGNLFVDIFEEEAAKLANAKWLAQGTIYPDVIESAAAKTGKAHLIKSHHNVGGLPDYMKLRLCEPLRELFKDEVRRLGVELGLPASMVYRHPFPGPGLGVRILGEVKKEYADILRLADYIFIEELHNHNLYDKVSQAFTVFLPVKSVGVTGDGRRYQYVVALRAVETIDFMTARWAHLPYEFLDRVSRRIINEVADISRVAYDISGKPPATIEWE